MKGVYSIIISIGAAALLAGCGNKSDSTAQGTNTVNSATNGFGGYVKTMAQEQKDASRTIDTTAITQAIQLFYVQEGRYPKNLQELVPGYMPKIPDAPLGSKIVYDQASGTVKVVPAP